MNYLLLTIGIFHFETRSQKLSEFLKLILQKNVSDMCDKNTDRLIGKYCKINWKYDWKGIYFIDIASRDISELYFH